MRLLVNLGFISSQPRKTGTVGPVKSASKIPALYPLSLKALAKPIATLDFPVPPLQLTHAIRFISKPPKLWLIL